MHHQSCALFVSTLLAPLRTRPAELTVRSLWPAATRVQVGTPYLCPQPEAHSLLSSTPPASRGPCRAAASRLPPGTCRAQPLRPSPRPAPGLSSASGPVPALLLEAPAASFEVLVCLPHLLEVAAAPAAASSFGACVRFQVVNGPVVPAARRVDSVLSRSSFHRRPGMAAPAHPILELPGRCPGPGPGKRLGPTPGRSERPIAVNAVHQLDLVSTAPAACRSGAAPGLPLVPLLILQLHSCRVSASAPSPRPPT
jgi:hypothetical protein